ncbi:carboxypeptidase regulatory-like domain-containing protein [Trichocoleus sp. FACHB-591]|uniref:carboxypeptidase regulatory-like domain-containing protein n=1 Tax=Trichocoleus sp. FACHB-591 TaxID=2692872 RepID=UPI0016881200|nr:carboxypeptidase regulatory-like domain-containing protein [Trichocoleus sp. FACHB-591]MBD2095307.1 carboxypeptidase regulatory-like domain-containing protein [Trichocoleus sp. FACHB-591]
MQNIKDWPLFIKICFGLIFLALVVAGLIEIPKLSEQQTSEQSNPKQAATELVNVDIIVVSDTAKPLENVEVRLVSKGAPEVRKTNTDGFVQIDIPARRDIEITLIKEGFKTARYTINLNNDPNRTRTYYLKPQKPK